MQYEVGHGYVHDWPKQTAQRDTRQRLHLQRLTAHSNSPLPVGYHQSLRTIALPRTHGWLGERRRGGKVVGNGAWNSSLLASLPCSDSSRTGSICGSSVLVWLTWEKTVEIGGHVDLPAASTLRTEFPSSKRASFPVWPSDGADCTDGISSWKAPFFSEWLHARMETIMRSGLHCPQLRRTTG